MNTTIKILMIAAAIATAGAAGAKNPQVCLVLSTIAYNVAVDRDKGVTEEAARKAIVETMSGAGKEVADGLEQMTKQIYENSSVAPEDIQQRIFSICSGQAD